MMHEFLSAHKSELIFRCREKVATRPFRGATPQQLKSGIPIFIEQLIQTLQVEQSADHKQSIEISGPSGGGKLGASNIGATAAQHGSELLRLGFTVDQVVHDYGDLCQSVTDLAYERNEPFKIDEFRTLNRCLDNGIADAVREFSNQRDLVLAHNLAASANERLGFFAHELRNLLNTATLALSAIKTGNVGVSGATGAVLDRSLVGLRYLIDRSLADVRISAGLTVKKKLFSLANFITEVQQSASLEAHVEECILTVSVVDPLLALDADRELLFSAVGNLLQNAFKFSPRGSEVNLVAYAAGDHILIDVKDQGKGLPPGAAQTMFEPFSQGHENKSGLGLGLSIALRSVEANQGTLTVVDAPGSGCVFTIKLPRYTLKEPV